MTSLKWRFSNFHFIGKILPFILFFLSCGENLKDIDSNNKSIQEIYDDLTNKMQSVYPADPVKSTLMHSEFLNACYDEKKFDEFIKANVELQDKSHCDELKKYLVGSFSQKKCCYHPPISNVKDVYQICLIPGFFIRTVDNYTPKIAQKITSVLLENKPKSAVETKILPRWSGYIKGRNDNTDFATQCTVLKTQLENIISDLNKRYNNPNIHLIFCCESFGGKIGLFFLNKYFEEITQNKVSIEKFITVHSPLYGMVLAKYMVDNQDNLMNLWNNEAFSLLISSIQYDFLNVLNVEYYLNTFKLLKDSAIENVMTDEALKNLSDKNVDIINFIGTPNDVILGPSLSPSYSELINILKILKSYFINEKSGEFLENKWNSLNNAIASISDIIFDLKNRGIFNAFFPKDQLLLKKTQNSMLIAILQCENKIDLQMTLNGYLKGFVDEKIFVDVNFKDAIKLLAKLLDDVTTILEKEVFDSDLVVMVDEITKSQTVINAVKNNRKSDFVIQDQGQFFICSPNIYHACNHGKINEFYNNTLNKCFVPYFEKNLK